MSEYITIDSGTTNTRISLVQENKVIDTLEFPVGARSGIDNQLLLKETIKNGITEISEKNKISKSSIKRILASGMITSELGLVALDHIMVPAGISELHSSMFETIFPDISDIPFVFVRGVKTCCDSLEHADMMRGEETELAGLFAGEGIYILPGSHSKIVKIDQQGRIVDFKTMLTGEMIAALSEHTILKSTVTLNNQQLNNAFLLKGYEYTEQYGLNNALFKVRVLKNILGKNPSEIYSFYMGAILYSEIQYVLSLKAKQIVVAGQLQIKEALTALLRQLVSCKIIIMPEKATAQSTALGIIKIYEYSIQSER